MALIRSDLSTGVENQSETLDFFVLYTKLNITATGNFSDKTQKDFESVIQVIGMQDMPVLKRTPLMLDGKGDHTLEKFGASVLKGAGWTARLAFEKKSKITIPKLLEELNGIVLNCGVIDTENNINMEIKEQE